MPNPWPTHKLKLDPSMREDARRMQAIIRDIKRKRDEEEKAEQEAEEEAAKKHINELLEKQKRERYDDEEDEEDEREDPKPTVWKHDYSPEKYLGIGKKRKKPE